MTKVLLQLGKLLQYYVFALRWIRSRQKNCDMMSILEALRDGAQQRPDRQVWTFLNDKGDPVDSYTYKVRTVDLTAILELLCDLNINSYIICMV